jgi:hypothetical protein
MSLFITSLNRTNPSAPVHTFQVQHGIDNSNAKCMIRLKQASIPNLVPLFEPTHQTVFVWIKIGAGANTLYSFDVPSSFSYTGATLASQLATQLTNLTSAAVTFTVTFSSSTGRLTISTAGGTFSFSSQTELQVETILGLEGLTSENGNLTSFTTLPLRLDGTSFVDVLFDVLSTRTLIHNNNNRCVGRIQMMNPPGSMCYYENTNHDADGLMLALKQLQTLHITLVNEWGNVFLLPANAHTSLCFSIVQLT